MKTITTISLLFALFFVSPLRGATVEIDWVNPEDFTDVKHDGWNTEKARNITLRDLQKYVETEVRRRFDEDVTIKLKVTDVDIEGEYEPWRHFGWQDVRIVKRIYPARLVFSYEILKDDKVILSGDEKLRHDLFSRPFNYQFEANPYTKELFRNWLRKEKSILTKTLHPGV